MDETSGVSAVQDELDAVTRKRIMDTTAHTAPWMQQAPEPDGEAVRAAVRRQRQTVEGMPMHWQTIVSPSRAGWGERRQKSRWLAPGPGGDADKQAKQREAHLRMAGRAAG